VIQPKSVAVSGLSLSLRSAPMRAEVIMRTPSAELIGKHPIQQCPALNSVGLHERQTALHVSRAAVALAPTRKALRIPGCPMGGII
jgi:hypothetical protein